MKYWILTSLAIVGFAVQAAHGWPAVFATGTTLYDPAEAYNGYTLFTPMGEDSTVVHLINMNGKVVHQWTMPFFAMATRLLPTGNLLVVGFDPLKKPGRPGVAPFWMGGTGGVLVEFNWQGDEVFRHSDLNMHHDAVKLPNGNYLYLAWEKVPTALREKVRGGIKNTEHRNLPPDAHVAPEDVLRAEKVMFNDVLVEVDSKGQVVWHWHANQHLDTDVDIIGIVHPRQEWCHTNTINLLGNGDILLTSRALDCMLVVSRKTGKVIFRWGGMTHLNKETGELDVTTTLDTLSGPHGAAAIPPGTPGAGNITCYDNGLLARGPLLASRAIEIDPTTADIVWQSTKLYEGRLPIPFGRKHFSDFLGSAQKLPNGNMLLCEGVNGRFFQLTKDLKQVWEYVNPFGSDARFNGSVFKAHCYPPDYCPQFKDLPPAKGPAVVPAADVASTEKASTKISTVADAGASKGPPRFADAATSPGALAAVGALVALVAFALGWGLRGRRTGGLQAATAEQGSGKRESPRR